MILLDANILLYAYDQHSPEHGKIRPWLEALLSGKETVGLPWVTAWAFVRIATNPRLNKQPLRAGEAMRILEELSAHPSVVMVNPGRSHREILLAQMRSAQVQGCETTDAVLAALAIEHGATLASTDAGFRRFPDLRWSTPLGRQ
ncbi:MAG: TA system VapC family ribonuclease toxin [Bryobacteraceae bacterium]